MPGCTCDIYDPGCICDDTCYIYVSCTCDDTCYEESCTCNTGDGTAGCTCDDTCYEEFISRPAPVIRLNGTDYIGTYQLLTGDFDDYEYIWTEDPSAAAAWGRDSANSISEFGVISSSATTNGVPILVSQIYFFLSWFPSQPVCVLRIFKNDVNVETIFRAVPHAGEESDQTLNLSSLMELAEGDTIRVSFTKVDQNLDVIIGNTAYTYMAIHRVEGQCV